MNAHKFVAGKGIEEAKRVLEGAYWDDTAYSNGYYYLQSCSENDVNLEELKQVVESVEIVARHGGLFCLKCQIEKGGYDFEWYGENGEFGFTELNVLAKAIDDYKLVESYKEK